MAVLIDFETFSELNLKAKPSCGVWAYAEHPSTEVLCMGYKIDTDSTQVWSPPDPFPAVVIEAIAANATFEAHNVQFERAVWRNLLKGKTTAKFFGQEYKLADAPLPMPSMWRDTMAVCAYRSLPLSLEDVGRVLSLAVQKSKAGDALLRALSRPRRPTKANPRTRPTYEEAHEGGLLGQLYAYCMQDVDAEYALSLALGWLPGPEAQVWALDQNINQRGVAVDLPAVIATKRVALEMEVRLTAELCGLVGDPEMTGKRVAKFLEWLAEHGATLPNLQKDTVEEWLQKIDRTEHPEVYRALEIRQQTALSSVAKLDAILSVVSRDARMRGLMQYHGSGTGRWAGRHFQPQNIPRPSATNRIGANGFKYLDMDLLLENLTTYNYDTIDMLYGDVGGALTSSLRGMLVAAPGKRLYVADFSAIEARVTMWLAGQEDKVKAFRDYDAGTGPDIYLVAAKDIFGFDCNKKDHVTERNMGKVQILGCGYQMSGAKLALSSGLDEERAAAIVANYRTKNYMVPRLWYGLQDAAISALLTGKTVEHMGIEYAAVRDAAGPWLTCKLPSGRKLWYYDPQLIEEPDWNGRPRWKLTYQGRDNKRAGTWNRVRTYGGMLTENVVQAISRCLLVSAMFRVEDSGYPIVLTVHDEIISETDDAFGSREEFNRLVSGPNPAWAATLPLAADGWTGHRYKKG